LRIELTKENLESIYLLFSKHYWIEKILNRKETAMSTMSVTCLMEKKRTPEEIIAKIDAYLKGEITEEAAAQWTVSEFD